MIWNRETKQALLRSQNAEVRLARPCTVTCICKKTVPIEHAYRCYFCRLWFCWTCAGHHFKKPEIR